MITQAELTAYAAELGVSLPSPIMAAITAKLATFGDALAAAYAPADVTLIEHYAGGVLVLSSGARQIMSQGANGASRAFAYGAQIDAMQASLRALDTEKITADLVAVAPLGFAQFTVSRG